MKAGLGKALKWPQTDGPATCPRGRNPICERPISGVERTFWQVAQRPLLPAPMRASEGDFYPIFYCQVLGNCAEKWCGPWRREGVPLPVTAGQTSAGVVVEVCPRRHFVAAHEGC